MTILELGKEHTLTSKLNIYVELNHGFHKESVDDIRSYEVVSELSFSI